MHINWLKNQICVLGCMLRSHARNGNEFQTPGQCWFPAKHWEKLYLNTSKSKNSSEIHETWHANMEWHQYAVVQNLSHLGQVWVWATHKPELLTTSMMVFGRERPTFGDETVSIASYSFQIYLSCQHRTTGVLCDFLGFVWTFLCINWVFNAFYVHNSNLNYMHML